MSQLKSKNVSLENLFAIAAAASPSLDLGDIKSALRAYFRKDPFESLITAVVTTSYLFYVAEKDVNPKVQSYWDALVFITTNLSVGYSDIFAKSDAGKLIASAVMTLGPSLTTGIWNEPDYGEQSIMSPENEAVVERLDKVIELLEANLKNTKLPAPDAA